ncbi:MAG TPA: HAD family phosphatase [Sphingobacterium sp.]|nr:HAD family phosphatase [Sphingobacterium sp.]
MENIILDYGNVIFDLDFVKLTESFEKLGVKNVEGLFSQAKQSPLFDAFDKGEISPQEFRDHIRKITEMDSLTDGMIDDAWNSLLIGVPASRHLILEKLKVKYRTFLLSNNNEIHYAAILKHLRTEHRITDNSVFFEKDYYSHLLRMRKPDKEIFEFVLATHQLDPDKTLFVDDSPQHLETAKSLGVHTALVTSGNPFESILEEYNLL